VSTPSQGLAIGSLICGILSLLCCASILTGPAAVIMGFIARKNANENPNQFGGAGLALAGMVCGGIGFVVGNLVAILWLMGTLARF
jgi:hypothetical protein